MSLPQGCNDDTKPVVLNSEDSCIISPTNGAKCKVCGDLILKGTFRIERLVPSAKGAPGIYDNHKYHTLCMNDPYNLLQKKKEEIEKDLAKRKNILSERKVLASKLKLLRRNLVAKQTKYKEYHFYTNAMIEDIVISLPRTKEDLLSIHGFGEEKYKLAGEAIFRLINQS
jgi:superfamily II DNA helicase RecQ